MSHPFYENRVLASAADPTRFFRVLRLFQGEDYLAIISMPGALEKPRFLKVDELLRQLADGEVTPVKFTDDPFAPPSVPDGDLTAAALKVRSGRLKLLEPLIGTEKRRIELLYPSSRWNLIEALCAETSGTRPQHVYKLLTRWWQRGQRDNSLLPDFSICGRRGLDRFAEDGAPKRGAPLSGYKKGASPGINITPVHLANIEGTIPLLLGKKSRYSPSDAYLEMLQNCYFENGELRADGCYPSPRQYRYHLDKLLRKQGLELRGPSEHEHNLKLRDRTGTTVGMSRGPGSIYIVDATVTDINLVRESARDKIIGRAVLYLVVDHWSHAIIGFYIGLRAPSGEGARLALTNAFTSKDEFCARLGVEGYRQGDWPMRHLCKQLVSDRGTEWLGDKLRVIGTALDFHLAKCPPYRADWKGSVEALFGLLKDALANFAPGIVQPPGRGPRKPDDAKWTLHEFRRVVVEFILHHNRSFEIQSKGWPPGYYPSDDRNPTPNDLWAFGLAHVGNVYLADEGAVARAMLPRVSVARRREGLSFGHQLFWEPVERALRRKLLTKRKHIGKFPRSTVAYDEQEMGRAWIVDEQGQLAAPLALTGPCLQFAKMAADEVIDGAKLARRRRAAGSARKNESKIRFRAKVGTITAFARVTGSEQRRNSALPAKRKTTVSENRAAEQAALAAKPDPFAIPRANPRPAVAQSPTSPARPIVQSIFLDEED